MPFLNILSVIYDSSFTKPVFLNNIWTSSYLSIFSNQPRLHIGNRDCYRFFMNVHCIWPLWTLNWTGDSGVTITAHFIKTRANQSWNITHRHASIFLCYRKGVTLTDWTMQPQGKETVRITTINLHRCVPYMFECSQLNT